MRIFRHCMHNLHSNASHLTLLNDNPVPIRVKYLEFYLRLAFIAALTVVCPCPAYGLHYGPTLLPNLYHCHS
jgi:hypothetical protein